MNHDHEQDAVPESHAQAVPYAAAVAELELPDRIEAVDQGVEKGLATAPATDQADVAYSLHAGGPAALEAPQPVESAVAAPEALQDVESMSAAPTSDVDDSQENQGNRLPANAMHMQALLSLDSQKRNNIHLLDSNTVLTSAGTSIILLDLTTCRSQYIPIPVSGGIGAIAASADSRHFVVGEKSRHGAPNAYIYQYPSLNIEQTLEHGTERAYSAAAFNSAGDRLATVGSYPDFMLTVWDWESGCTMLRSKAFSQEVYCVSFCPYSEGALVTSGTGHIRFWSMARTFTGLKLQGSIGKFGNEELSDVSGYADLPDGMVLCGAENGSLLMWSGGLIKFVVRQSPEVPCHQGAVTVVLAEQNKKRILTAGTDGFVKLWSLTALSEADSGEDSQYFFLQPLEQLHLGLGVRIRGLLWQSQERWLVSDEGGSLIQVTLPKSGSLKEARIQQLLSFHSGSIAGLATSPYSHLAITAGADGTVRLHDYWVKKTLYHAKFDTAAHSLLFLPTALDSTARTVLVGFSDGVVRGMLLCLEAWKVTSTFKPHSGAVNTMAMSADCSMLATAGQDSTVFLFKVASTTVYEPVGFFRLTQPACCLAWSPDSTKLLAGCSSGIVIETAIPQDVPKSTDTFELQVAQQHFTVALPKAPANNAEGQAESVQAPSAEEPQSCCPIYTLQCLTSGEQGFLATAGGAAQGLVLKCSMEVEGALTAQPTHQAGVTTLRVSQGGRLLMQGFSNGMMRVSEAGLDSTDLTGMLAAPFWEGQVHDCQTGSITALATSFDDSFLLSAAQDGTLYIHDVKLAGVSRQEGNPLDVPLAAAEPTPEVSVSGDGYSLEEARKKREEDKLLAAADAKKRGVRAYVQELRTEFAQLVEANAVAQLPESEFEVDPGLRDMVEAQIKQEEEAVRQELAWESEKKRLAVAKLRKHFLGDLEVEHIVLHAFRSDKKVSSFKTRHLAADIQEELQRLGQGPGLPTKDSQPTSRNPSTSLQPDAVPSVQLNQASSNSGPGPQALQQSSADPAVSKQELRRLARKRREAELLAFSATRPDNSFESPADVQAIRLAQQNIGDFKLKSDPSYIPPEAQRSTVNSKRRQMLVLDEAVYNVKMDFNKRFLALREVKKKVCQQVAEVQGRLRHALAALGKPTASVVDPVLKPEEVPELRDQVSEEELAQYMASQQQAGHTLPGITLSHSTKPQAGAPSAPHLADSSALPVAPLSELEIAEQTAKNRKLEYEQQRLEKEVEDMQEAFDAGLALLSREKLSLEADVKAAEIKRLTYQQEMQLLKDSEGREQELTTRLAGKHTEQAELAGRVADCQARLESKLQELRAVAEAKQQVVSRFDELVEEGHAARDALLKIFNKKIKRSKQKDAGLAVESSEDSSDEDKDDSDDDDGVEDSEGGEETCPPGCDPNLYDKVCELREARLDEEDAGMEVGRSMEQVKKDRESLSKKERIMDQALKAISDEALAFQREKQARLNQVEVVLLLRLHQIHILQEDGQVPSDLSGALLFSSAELDKLKRRVHELADERSELKLAQQQLRHEHVQLLKDKTATQAKLAELQQKATDVQMLKFGQVIDLDILDKVGSAKGVEEVREQLKQQEAAHAQELARWDAQIRARNDELMRLTNENTHCLTAVAEYTRHQTEMENTLASTQAHIFGDPAAQRRAEITERDALVQLVNTQAQQLETLRAQLLALRSKSGPVL